MIKKDGKTIVCDGHGCGMEHDIKERTFLTVSGNIYVGKDGGIVGNNFPGGEPSIHNNVYCGRGEYRFTEEEIRKSHYCFNCLVEILNEARDYCRGVYLEEYTKQVDYIKKIEHVATKKESF